MAHVNQGDSYDSLLATYARPADDQQERPHHPLREVSKRSAGARRGSMAGRTRAAHLRERLPGSVEALGRAHEDDPQRVSADALAERGAGTRGEAHGGLL